MKPYADIAEWRADASEWQGGLIDRLLQEIRAGGEFEESIKWGNAVFVRQGPAILVRHEPERVILGFFRGKRMIDIEPRLKPSGKYELANLEWRSGDELSVPERLEELARLAAALNDEHGDPTKV